MFFRRIHCFWQFFLRGCLNKEMGTVLKVRGNSTKMSFLMHLLKVGAQEVAFLCCVENDFVPGNILLLWLPSLRDRVATVESLKDDDESTVVVFTSFGFAQVNVMMMPNVVGVSSRHMSRTMKNVSKGTSCSRNCAITCHVPQLSYNATNILKQGFISALG